MTSVPRTPSARELVAARQAQAPVVQPEREIVPTTPENYRARYLDECAPSGIVGRLVKFDKTGTFVTSDDGEEVDEDAEFIALCDQTVIGWQKFNGPGEPPDKVMGLLYDCHRARALAISTPKNGSSDWMARNRILGSTPRCSSCKTPRPRSSTPSRHRRRLGGGQFQTCSSTLTECRRPTPGSSRS